MNPTKVAVIDITVADRATSPANEKMTNLSNTASVAASPQQGLTFGISSILGPNTNPTSTEPLAGIYPVASHKLTSSGTVSDSNFGIPLNEPTGQSLSEWASLALQSTSARAFALDTFLPEMLSARNHCLFGGLQSKAFPGHTASVGCNNIGGSIASSSSTSSPGENTIMPTTATPPTNLQAPVPPPGHYSFADTLLNAGRMPALSDPSSVFSLAQSAISPVQNYPLIGTTMPASLTNNLLQCLPSIDQHNRALNNPFLFPSSSRNYLFDFTKYPIQENIEPQTSFHNHNDKDKAKDKNRDKDSNNDDQIDIETVEMENSFESKSNKRKRSWSRAVFSNVQRRSLERRFLTQKYVTKPDRKQLASSLGLTDAQVKVWFQNRRMKWRHSKEYKEQITKDPLRCDTLRTSSFITGSFDPTVMPANLLNSPQFLQFRSSIPVSKPMKVEQTATGNH